MLGALAVAAALVRCAILTGDTAGYSLVPDAATYSCHSAADCDAGQVCCLTLSIAASGLNAVAACQSGPPCRSILPGLPGVQPIQFCEAGAECADDAGCLSQRCSPGDAADSVIKACGHIVGCQFP
jgi:hypothetical protein